LLLRVWVELRRLVPLDLLQSTVIIVMRGHAKAMTKVATKRRGHVIVTFETGIVKRGKAVISIGVMM
jgi:hypothetical protein